MPKNVMKLVKPSPHRARNDFDLSHRAVFSQNFGELIPSTCIETVPGDHIELSVANLVRAIPLVTSPFLRAKQHVDVWFVPYKDLWHNFDNFVTQRTQPVSSAMKDHKFLPHTDIYDLYSNVNYGGAAQDVAGRSCSVTSPRLLNMLGYADSAHASATNPHKVNLFRLAAYNYIWYNEYRQQYYDDGTRILGSGANPAALFNFDDLVCDTEANADISATSLSGMTWQSRLSAMAQMRYRCWKKDLFTGLLPSTQFGNISTLGLSPSKVGLSASGTSNPSTFSSIGTNGDGTVIADSSRFLEARVGDASFDILALRKSEAVQIWRENALRAGNRVKDNMEAHYGIESDFRDHRPTYIGSVDSPLNIGDVIATANSDYSGNTNPNTNVGDIAGKGTSALDDNRFKFDAKDFGVIMAISSILPEAEYNAFGIDRMNQLLESEDFFVPEYENLGLEPVSSCTFLNTPSNVSQVIGYAPRYIGYKQKLDLCYGDFTSGRMFAPLCSPKFDVSNLLATPGAMPLTVLYVNPAIFNVNFSLAVGTSDQFLNDTYFDVDAVRPMSVLGLPFS